MKIEIHDKPEWSRAPRDVEKQKVFLRQHPRGKEYLKMIMEKLEWMADRDKRISIGMETFIAMFPLERQEVRKAINAFANLLTMDQHRNILCSSMKLEDINEEVKLTIK